jgi:uncharacterized membrane protein (DUF485 family)
MKRIITLLFLACFFLLIALKSNAQSFINQPVHTDSACYDGSNYDLYTIIFITGVRITHIYNDNGPNSSFSFEMVFTVANFFIGTVGNGATDFWTYDVTFYTHNPNISSPSISNNLNGMHLSDTAAGLVDLHNNATYNGSASALGLDTANGGFYTWNSISSLFGYDSLALKVMAPCLDATLGNNTLTTLPVKLAHFTAAQQSEHIVLQWQTYSEQNNKGFYLEKSNDGKKWAIFSQMDSKAIDGNSNTMLSYFNTDENPIPGMNYYRLIQKDRDNKMTISSIASVWYKNKENNALRIYPNPATDLLQVSALSGSFDKVHYSLVNIMGQVMTTGIANGTTFNISTSGLANGTYILKVGNKNYKAIIAHP